MSSFLRLLRSELALMFSRRRNQAGLLVLAGVPIMMSIAINLSGHHHDRGGGGGPSFIDQITQNGLFVPLAALTVELGLFLPMAVAMVSGDAIAGEAHQGTLRYLLTVPVTRVRLLAVKYVALVIGAFVATLAVVVAGLLVGSVLFGVHPMVTLSGTTIGVGAGLWRIVLATLYVAAGLAALAAIGLFASTLTEQPIAVTVAVMVVTTAMWITDSIPQLAALHPWLLVDRWQSFTDLLREPPMFSTMSTGLLVDAAYAAVFLLAAWARFGSEDITS